MATGVISQRLKLAGVAALTAIVALLVAATLTPGSATPGGVHVEPPAVVHEGAPSALFVGDSFFMGSGAPSEEEAVSCLTARAMGWVCNLDAQPGTGYTADGKHLDPAYGRLIDRLPATHRTDLADVVIIDAGRNDKRVPAADLKTAITEYLAAVRTAWPKAEIVVIEPYVMNSQGPVLDADVLAHLRTEATRFKARVINPQSDGWVLPGGTHKDLDAADHRYIAQRIVAALRALGLDELQVTDDRNITD